MPGAPPGGLFHRNLLVYGYLNLFQPFQGDITRLLRAQGAKRTKMLYIDFFSAGIRPPGGQKLIRPETCKILSRRVSVPNFNNFRPEIVEL